jgi:hypothetical protein
VTPISTLCIFQSNELSKYKQTSEDIPAASEKVPTYLHSFTITNSIQTANFKQKHTNKVLKSAAQSNTSLLFLQSYANTDIPTLLIVSSFFYSSNDANIHLQNRYNQHFHRIPHGIIRRFLAFCSILRLSTAVLLHKMTHHLQPLQLRTSNTMA